MILKLVPGLRDKNINEFCFINCDWISDCLRDSQVIDPSSYSRKFGYSYFISHQLE